MTERAGVLRSRDGLLAAVTALDDLTAHDADLVDVPAWETTNLLTVSRALTEAALRREETRGSHWREDFPDRDDAHWSHHLDVTLREGRASLPEPQPTGGTP
jgi:L-aspartate oxidase